MATWTATGKAALIACAAGAILLRSGLYWWLAQLFGGLAHASCHFDCDFYLRIAEHGYGADTHFHDRGSYPNWAYFPLYPMLVRSVTALTGAMPVPAGFAVSTLSFLGFAIFGAFYVQRARPAPNPVLWLLVVCAAPYGFFFSIPYTEALFAALVAAALWARAADLRVAAACFAALAAASRPTGILVSMVIIADQALLPWHTRHDRRALEDWTRLLLPAVIAPLGLSLYMGWQYWQIGDGLAFSHVQVSWDRRWLGPITWLRLGLRQDDWGNVTALFPAQSYAFNATCALLGLIAAGWLAARRRWAEAWICGGAILLPLASGLHSMPRFVGANPVFLIAGYDLLCLISRTWLPGVLMLLAGCQVVLLVAWYSRADGLF